MLRKITRAIIAANMWYDDIEEPKRFLFFIGAIGVPLILIGVFINMWLYIPMAIILIGCRLLTRSSVVRWWAFYG